MDKLKSEQQWLQKQEINRNFETTVYIHQRELTAITGDNDLASTAISVVPANEYGITDLSQRWVKEFYRQPVVSMYK